MTGLKAEFSVKLKSSIKFMGLANKTIRRLLHLIPDHNKVEADKIVEEHVNKTKNIFIEMEGEG